MSAPAPVFIKIEEGSQVRLLNTATRTINDAELTPRDYSGAKFQEMLMDQFKATGNSSFAEPEISAMVIQGKRTDLSGFSDKETSFAAISEALADRSYSGDPAMAVLFKEKEITAARLPAQGLPTPPVHTKPAGVRPPVVPPKIPGKF